MKAYLVQHAEALSEEQNPDRPLSDLGRRHVQSVADVAARLGVEVRQVYHSGKTRALQTAEILTEALSPSKGVMARSDLSPLDDVKPVAEELDDASEPVMLVGHLPFMERLAGFMLTGDADQAVVDFCNAGIVCLEKGETRWHVEWILTPQMAVTAI